MAEQAAPNSAPLSTRTRTFTHDPVAQDRDTGQTVTNARGAGPHPPTTRTKPLEHSSTPSGLSPPLVVPIAATPPQCTQCHRATPPQGTQCHTMSDIEIPQLVVREAHIYQCVWLGVRGLQLPLLPRSTPAVRTARQTATATASTGATPKRPPPPHLLRFLLHPRGLVLLLAAVLWPSHPVAPPVLLLGPPRPAGFRRGLLTKEFGRRTGTLPRCAGTLCRPSPTSRSGASCPGAHRATGLPSLSSRHYPPRGWAEIGAAAAERLQRQGAGRCLLRDAAKSEHGDCRARCSLHCRCTTTNGIRPTHHCATAPAPHALHHGPQPVFTGTLKVTSIGSEVRLLRGAALAAEAA